jgi:sugar phosphate permease
MTTNGTNAQSTVAERWMAFIWRKPPPNLGERTRRRIVVHLIPWLFFLYILAYLDRVNIAVAGLDMQEPPSKGGLGFDRDVIGFGFGLFFAGYWILEVPSTVSVVRWGARWVFVRILILWGISSTLVGFIGMPFATSLFGWLPHLPEHSAWGGAIDRILQGSFGWIFMLFQSDRQMNLIAGTASFVNDLPTSAENQFYFFRFMLGFFEGGFFPSVIVYLTLWFRAQDRAKAIATFMSAIPVSNILGNPFSGWLLRHVDWFGLPGWRWILILEGIAPIVAAFATLFFLPDRPQKAAWLPDEERNWLCAELEREHHAKKGHGHWVWVKHLGTVLLLTAVYFCLNLTSYGLQSFLPDIIRVRSGLRSDYASYLAAVPHILGLIAMLLNGWHSDRTGERPWHVAIPLTLWSLGIFLASLVDGSGFWPVVVLIVGVGPFLYAHLPAFWPIPTMFLGAVAAASAIGFINMTGNLGGFVGPNVVGKATKAQFRPGTGAEIVGFTAVPMGGPLLAANTAAAEGSQHRVSFAPAMRRLAPWPLVSAVIILIVGYTRRRIRQKAA